jgi:chlorite dismutase
MSDKSVTPVVPAEGWHVLHLFYRVEHGQWHFFDAEERRAARTRMAALVQEIRALPSTQLLTFSMVSPKADLGFMLLTPDLQTANRCEKRLSVALGPDVLTPVFSYLSMTERSEYTTSEAEYAKTLHKEQKLEPGSPEHEKALTDFRNRMAKYLNDRLYPKLPDWPVFCFYPMSKRRGEQRNWYALGFEERKKLMGGHARIGRAWHGRILQLITGSTGLDDSEWGVTLFAHDTINVKNIVYEMRFDTVSAEYADFGEFYIGLQLALDEVLHRVLLE